MENDIWKNLKVLAADDQRFMLNVLVRIMKGMGIPVDNIHLASNGDEAIDILRKSHVDIVVCDINMGPGNGLKLLKTIRMDRSEGLGDLPLILITGHSDQATVRTALQLDVNGFIIKPVSADALSAKISHALNDRITLKAASAYAKVDVSLSAAIREHAALHGQEVIEGEAPAQHNDADDDDPAEPDHQNVPVEGIRENDVVLEDVRSAEGAVWIKAGSVLTADVIRSIQKQKHRIAEAGLVIARRDNGN